MRRLLLFLLLLSLITGNAVSQIKQLPEYSMKAAFVYNFTLFTRWPTLPDNTLKICTLHADRLREELEQFVTEQPHGAKLIIHKITHNQEVAQCQVMFLSGEDLSQASAILSLAKENPVLTITDVPVLIQKDVIIVMKIENQRMVFEIDLKAAKNRGLYLSSRLLSLAKKVH